MPVKSKPAGKGGAGQIRIRMYRVGFGDCFLVTLPAGDGKKHILVDCGVHGQGDIKVADDSGKPVSLISRAVANIRAETEGKLAIVIATHKHQDHISGFDPKAFEGFHVDEVWMPWTDNPKDKKALALAVKQAALVEHLTAHFAVSPAAPGAMSALANLTANPTAMKLLHSGFGTGKAKYLEAGMAMEDAGGVKGLSVKVLGPPRDEKFLSKMDPPAGQKFLRAAAAGAGDANEDVNSVQPFLSLWTDGEARGPSLEMSAQMKKGLDAMDAAALNSLAFALDHVRNNTSVVVLLTYRGQHLLFPGDAQYGNWSAWISGPDADEILGKVSFYKTAHHGSYNATPKAALEKMPQGEFAAMVSTQNEPWPSIPLPDLMKAMVKRTGNQVARSDTVAVKAVGKKAPGVTDKLAKCFQAGEFWIDYTITP